MTVTKQSETMSRTDGIIEKNRNQLELPCWPPRMAVSQLALLIICKALFVHIISYCTVKLIFSELFSSQSTANSEENQHCIPKHQKKKKNQTEMRPAMLPLKQVTQ